MKGFPSAKIYMITSLDFDPNCTCARGEIMMACSRVTAMEMMRMMRFGIYFLIRMRNTWGFGITEERCCHRSSSLGDGVCVSEIWVPEFMGDWFQKWYMWGSKGSQTEGKGASDVVAIEASVDSTGSSEAGTTIYYCPIWGKGAGPLFLTSTSNWMQPPLERGCNHGWDGFLLLRAIPGKRVCCELSEPILCHQGNECLSPEGKPGWQATLSITGTHSSLQTS